MEKPAPAVEEKKESVTSKTPKTHGFTIEVDSEKSIRLTPEEKAKLTPEQLYKLELARLENTESSSFGESQLVPILVPSALFAMIVAIVAIVVWARFRRARMLHDTVRLMAEKGQSLPPEIFQNSPKPKSDLRRGLVWSGLGLGVIGYLAIDHSSNWGVGFIPLFIGIGYLLAWKLEPPANSKSGA